MLQKDQNFPSPLITRGIGLLAGLFLATSPAFAFQARVAEMYTLHLLLVFLLFYLFDKSKESTTYSLSFAFVLGLSITNHYPLVVFALLTLWICEGI